MKQLKTLEQLKSLFPNSIGIDAAILYGSFGRGDGSPNSDIDIQLLINSKFTVSNFIDQLTELLNPDIYLVREITLRKKIVAYFKSQPKIEFALCSDSSEINKNYIGSEITDVKETILFERLPSTLNLTTYLSRLAEDSRKNQTNEISKKAINELIEKFMYEFESCSVMQRRSDGYQFYFFYNIALQVAIQLNQLSKQQDRFNFLPKYFIANILTKEEQEPFYTLNGTLFLPEANGKKRKMLDFFYAAIEKLISIDKFEEIKKFCEWVYNRDFFWNFRDVSTHNPKLKSGVIYRTATLTVFQKEVRFINLLKEHKINTIIDLRADKEIEELPYHEENASTFRYVKAQLDPWNQPDWFKQNYHYGTNEEIAYRYFAIGCKDQIRDAMTAILDEEEGAVAVHCFAGKDRTGIFISMLHLLAESPLETIHADYLASEVDVKLSRLNLVLDFIQESGGIEPYLLSCGLAEDDILKLKHKILA